MGNYRFSIAILLSFFLISFKSISQNKNDLISLDQFLATNDSSFNSNLTLNQLFKGNVPSKYFRDNEEIQNEIVDQPARVITDVTSIDKAIKYCQRNTSSVELIWIKVSNEDDIGIVNTAIRTFTGSYLYLNFSFDPCSINTDTNCKKNFIQSLNLDNTNDFTTIYRFSTEE
ncbi:MAG: hypothetical protein H6600_10115 [Flavobacteriales bacterium]|nr:hypothetical protein [Flavobacteriales bacterium]MCB9195750.1 hypothetical protein [Flavobacteriales bacterium]MCB9198804.1 hypothetical protein [Flavobacteriales bacterium]